MQAATAGCKVRRRLGVRSFFHLICARRYAKQYGIKDVLPKINEFRVSLGAEQL